jgi:hypothetical protein
MTGHAEPSRVSAQQARALPSPARAHAACQRTAITHTWRGGQICTDFPDSDLDAQSLQYLFETYSVVRGFPCSHGCVTYPGRFRLTN